MSLCPKMSGFVFIMSRFLLLSNYIVDPRSGSFRRVSIKIVFLKSWLHLYVLLQSQFVVGISP